MWGTRLLCYRSAIALCTFRCCSSLRCVACLLWVWAYAVQTIYLMHNSIEDVILLLKFEFVRVLADGLSLSGCSFAVVGIEVGVPEISYTEHKIRIHKDVLE